jgi:hypothetical protein
MVDQDANGHTPQTEELRIDTAAPRRWLGWLAYLVILLTVAAAVVWAFLFLNVSFAVAVTLVVVMLGYMSLMGWWLTRDADQTDDGKQMS